MSTGRLEPRDVAPPMAAERVVIVDPLPADWLTDAWAWRREEPQWNFDDFSRPRDRAAFGEQMELMRRAGIRHLGVLIDDEPSGVLSVDTANLGVQTLIDVVFSRPVCGRGGPRLAVRRVVDALFRDGARKVTATFFADDVRAERFFSALGFSTEGVLRDHALRQGRPASVRLMARFPSPGGPAVRVADGRALEPVARQSRPGAQVVRE